MVKNNWYSIIPIKARYNLGTPGKPSYWNRSIHSTPKKGIVVSTHRFCGSRLSRTAPFSALLLFVSVMAARFFSLLIFSSARFCFHGKKEIKRERERSLRLRPICLATEQSAFLTRRRPASRHGADTAVIKILFFPSLSLFSLSLSLSSSRHCNSWLTAASTAAAAAAAAAAVVLFSFILFFSLFPTTRARRRPLIFLFIIISFASPGRAVFFVYLFHCQRPGSMLFSDFVSPLSLSLSLSLSLFLSFSTFAFRWPSQAHSAPQAPVSILFAKPRLPQGHRSVTPLAITFAPIGRLVAQTVRFKLRPHFCCHCFFHSTLGSFPSDSPRHPDTHSIGLIFSKMKQILNSMSKSSSINVLTIF